ncbi:MAG: hypothetical protein K9H64_19880 [Bacteroidales bacterium]|nr:hypothetical protein [Bacteroidales bacterium]MCF8458322.1 hypothetical protein [Bacteroidales bacterium]
MILFVVWTNSLFAQQNHYSFQKEFSFSNYLILQNEFQEAIFVLDKIQPTNSDQTDSLNYLKGWALYNDKQLKESAVFLQKISVNSRFHTKSIFFSAYNNYHIGYICIGDSILSSIILNDELEKTLRNFELAGSSLLKRDLADFDKRASHFHQQYYQFANEEEKLLELRKRIGDFNPKSPVVAGILSAIVPGLGKIYSGHVGGGVSAFLVITALGAITWENYHKAGTNNPKTWIYGSAFAMTYAGNIFGSVYSVKAYRDEFEQHISKAVLFNMHIPLRNFFN